MQQNITWVVKVSFIPFNRWEVWLLLLLLSCITPAGFAQSKIDSLKERAESDNFEAKSNALMELFIAYRLTDLDSALYFAEQSQDLSYEYGDSLMIVRTEIAVGYVYQEKGFYQLAIDHFQNALHIARRNQFKDREKFVLNNLGLTYYYYGKYDEALQYHFQSLSLREEENNQLEIAISCNNIGLVYYQIKDYNKAIEYFKRSLEIKKSLKDESKIEGTLINLGLCFSDLNNYDEAVNNFTRVLKLCERNGCEDRIKVDALNGAGLAYHSLDNVEQAELYLRDAMEIATNVGLQSHVVNNAHYLARIKKEKGSIKEALELLNDSQDLAEKIDSRVWINKNYKLYGEIYALLKDFERAYEYQSKYDSLSGLILNEEVIQNLANIQINYQERENLETISLQKSEISRRTTLLILSIIIIFLAVVILVILFRNNQLRRKVNRKLYEANEAIEKQNLELTNMNTVLEERVRERTQELNESNAALLKSNNELDNFIYKTSHDIRGPLATLQGVCNVALIDIEDKKSIDYFSKLSKTAERLNEILSKLLVINQINNSLISDEHIDFDTMITDIICEQQNAKTLKAISVEKEVQCDLQFRSDQDLLRIILTNLISNAFKFYNTSGRVDSFINIKVFSNDRLHVQVIDNGIGIDENVSYKIFEIFSKASDMSDTAGLGLYLVKLAVEKLGGDITLSKARGSFTQFEVVLPFH
ncbi:tetratricopeptide repeat-containing sensor histidine kinase [Fulvivirga ulvae]|uniref:tetratricopeptide repeat-containing sensor histidine kinase n=1 Tax=Fulvivirga ulvae TaxID=2904245 RepID=UPI001F315413|nr:tetratricopeptide repeat-containing sensor histidine kinase [Fulvivirga ulvae]UII29937.1 tetratricopeptide repeat-containing sensor histidine kinase [Fulvivirga ulvae]